MESTRISRIKTQQRSGIQEGDRSTVVKQRKIKPKELENDGKKENAQASKKRLATLLVYTFANPPQAMGKTMAQQAEPRHLHVFKRSQIRYRVPPTWSLFNLHQLLPSLDGLSPSSQNLVQALGCGKP